MKSSIYLLSGLAACMLLSCGQQPSKNNNSATTAANTDSASTSTVVIVDSMKFAVEKPAANDTMTHEQTEFYKPVPPKVTPGAKNSNPPSDAIVLFNGKDLHQWVETDDTTKPAQWVAGNGIFTVKPGTGNIQTRQKFQDYQLHLEFREPKEPGKKGQNHGNSGLFLASLGKGDDGYEIQILNCYKTTTYTNGQTGSIYKQFPPLVNACKPAGEWQTYDIVWMAPRFDESGKLTRPATITAFQNGVLIQNHSILKGVTLYVGHPYYYQHGPAPIKLQDHHHKVSYRNIWIRPLK